MKTIIYVTIFLLLISCCYALISIEHPTIEEYPLTNITYYINPYNESGIKLTNTTTSCDLRVYNQSGSGISSSIMDYNSYGFYARIDEATINIKQYYSITSACNNTQSGGFVSQKIYITNTEKEGPSSIISTIIILPILFGFLLLFAGFTMSEEHTLIKMLLFFLSYSTLWVSLHLSIVSLVKFYNFPELEEIIGTTTYWVGLIFFVILSYFCIYIIIKAFETSAENKIKRLEY